MTQTLHPAPDDPDHDSQDARPAPGWTSRFARSLRAAAGSLTDAIIPPVCLGCHTPLATHDALCAPCWSAIDFIRAPLCDRLGIPLGFDTGCVMISAAANADPPDYDRARAVAIFSGTMQRLVHGFKYSDRHEARRLFGRWLHTAGLNLIADADLIIPIPLNRWRLLHRRYNQSAILAGELARACGKPIAYEALRRVKHTPSQVGMTRAERNQNVSGAFKVAPSQRAAIANRHILLIDDVITTGSTGNAAARALKSAGARHVDILALALVTHTVS
jgi:ComF family protein